MTTLAKSIARSVQAAIGNDQVWITDYGNGIVNVSARGRDLTRTDVDATRKALTAAGYTEVESWVARQGMSWLSDGIASVSFRITATERSR